MATREFDIGTVLTIAANRLVAPKLMDDVYAILNFMTQDDLYTHQLPRAIRECRPFLERQHPQLAAARFEMLDELLGPIGPANVEIVEKWLKSEIAHHGWPQTLPVESIPQEERERKHPLSELAEMVPQENIIVVTTDQS